MGMGILRFRIYKGKYKAFFGMSIVNQCERHHMVEEIQDAIKLQLKIFDKDGCQDYLGNRVNVRGSVWHLMGDILRNN